MRHRKPMYQAVTSSWKKGPRHGCPAPASCVRPGPTLAAPRVPHPGQASYGLGESPGFAGSCGPGPGHRAGEQGVQFPSPRAGWSLDLRASHAQASTPRPPGLGRSPSNLRHSFRLQPWDDLPECGVGLLDQPGGPQHLSVSGDRPRPWPAHQPPAPGSDRKVYRTPPGGRGCRPLTQPLDPPPPGSRAWTVPAPCPRRPHSAPRTSCPGQSRPGQHSP